MKAILKISTGETAEIRELTGFLEFPNFIISKGHLYGLVERNPSEATYHWEECLHLEYPMPNAQQPITEDLLIDLCEPYLLDLIGFLVECMRQVGESSVPDIARDSQYDLTNQVIVQIDQLDYLQKASVMAAAANYVKAIAQREEELTTNDK